jgi:hypothetical protein
MMTEKDLLPLLEAYGLLPGSTRPVARPHLTRTLRTQLAKVKKAHRSELENAKEMRTYVLNLTRGVARPQIVAELVKEGHNEAAYLLTFNDEQLALLMAWRSIKTAGAGVEKAGAGSSSQIKPKAKPRAGKARAGAEKAGAGSSSQIKPKAKPRAGKAERPTH